jgi:hypothetical protein
MSSNLDNLAAACEAGAAAVLDLAPPSTKRKRRGKGMRWEETGVEFEEGDHFITKDGKTYDGVSYTHNYRSGLKGVQGMLMGNTLCCLSCV